MRTCGGKGWTTSSSASTGPPAPIPTPADTECGPDRTPTRSPAFLGRAVPEVGLDLPPTAIGKDYLDGEFVSASPGGGVQASLYGLAGILAGPAEGIEINLLGMVFGAQVWPPAIKLPFVGRLGWVRARPRSLS